MRLVVLIIAALLRVIHAAIVHVTVLLIIQSVVDTFAKKLVRQFAYLMEENFVVHLAVPVV